MDPDFPYRWFWHADDGRVYSAAAGGLVAATDPAFVAFGESGRRPTRWPQDDAGDQTEAALQEVLTPYGLWVDLVAYAADRRWRRETGGMLVGGLPIATDDRSKLMITGARLAATLDPGWSTSWHGADGNTYPVDAAAMIAISDAVQAHVNATFAAFAVIKAAIDSDEITSIEEVDAAFSAA